MKFKKLLINISGLFLILNGFSSLLGGKSHIKLVGWLTLSLEHSLYLVIAGLFIIIFGNVYYSKKIKQIIEYSKCPKCKESYTYSNLEKGICPKCNIKTIDIDKYYDNENKK